MIKKLSIFIIIILITAISGWIYLAKKFETIAKEEIIPKLQKNESIVSVDQDSIVIDKYKFKLSLQNVTAFQNSKLFKMHADKIIVCYNPFSDSIKAQIIGDKLTIGEDDLKIYFPSPNHIIDFNRSLLKNDIEQFKITISSTNSSIYFAKDDKFISKSDDSVITISNSLDNDMYKMHLGMKIDALQVNPESQFSLKALKQIAPEYKLLNQTSFEYAENDIKQKLDNLYYNILNEIGPINYQTDYSIELGKNHVFSLVSALNGKRDIKEVLNEFSFTKDIYSVSTSESMKNSSINQTSNIKFCGDGEKINARINFESSDSGFDEEQKLRIIHQTNEVLLTLFKILNKDNPSKIDNNITAEDFTKISEMLININKTEVKIGAEYDINSNNLEQEILLSLGDFNIKSEGKVNDKVYNGTFEISNPKLLIDTIGNIYENSMRPILIKLVDNPEDEKTVAGYDKITRNIQENGFGALSALHKEDELKENDKLVSELLFDPASFKFKVNNKGFFEILTDERVAKFLGNFPSEDKEKDK